MVTKCFAWMNTIFIVLCISDKEPYSTGKVVGAQFGGTLHIWQMLDLHSQRATAAQS